MPREPLEAIVLVGGQGTRLRPLTLSEPKPLLPTAGVPFLLHMLSRIREAGIDHVVLGTSYRAEVFESYFGDGSAFGLEIVKAVGSPRVKLLSDLYHMQIMEGDLIRTLRDNKDYIAHFHTGGVPGRHELDDTQEVNWRAVAAAIAATGFQGYIAHEFVPTRDPLTSLREAVALCDV